MSPNRELAARHKIENERKKKLNAHKMMNCGIGATIIEYINTRNITVKFDNGEILENKTWSQFKKGNLKPVSISYKSQRTGEHRIMNCGIGATLTEYINSLNCTVKFDTGETHKNTTYEAFKKGTLRPTKTSPLKIGDTNTLNCGLTATIINKTSNDRYTIKFSNGEIRENIQSYHFRSGKLEPLSFKTIEHKYIGKKILMNCGIYATCIDYKDKGDCSVKFDTGEIREHISWKYFKDGSLLPSKIKTNHLHERKQMNCGLWAEIIEYECYKNITIRFDTGYTTYKRSYADFKKGLIKPYGEFKGYKIYGPVFGENENAYYRTINIKTGKKDVMTIKDMEKTL